jgi:hypothetical protein
LRAKTIANGCTEDEALSTAAKVAELLDRHHLSLSDIDLRASSCERRVYETRRIDDRRIRVFGRLGCAELNRHRRDAPMGASYSE